MLYYYMLYVTLLYVICYIVICYIVILLYCYMLYVICYMSICITKEPNTQHFVGFQKINGKLPNIFEFPSSKLNVGHITRHFS